VITHNSEAVVQACLESLAEMAPEFSVIVVDNASAGRPRAHIANLDNRGFAGAANQGFEAATTDVVLLLNPDVRVGTPLGSLTKACRETGLAAGQLRDASGRVQSGFTIRRFPTPVVLALELMGINRLWSGNPWNRKYRYLDRDLSQHGLVEQPAGAFLMVRRDVWQQLGGFDERFHPVWFEDVDFCRRATQAGFGISYVPEVWAQHLGGHSIKALDWASREVHWYDSLLRYAEKHFQPWQYRVVCLAGLVSTVPRAILGMIRERDLKPLGIWLYLFNLAGRRLVSRRVTEQRSRRGK
jgi:N-acetylglucosaminyl-diphospho-decaprenol L-rhamnosyltransferase